MVLEWFDRITLETFKVNKLSTGIERKPHSTQQQIVSDFRSENASESEIQVQC